MCEYCNKVVKLTYPNYEIVFDSSKKKYIYIYYVIDITPFFNYVLFFLMLLT